MAAEPIPLHEAAQHPLVAIPESLLMTADAAQQRLGPALARQQQQAARRRPWWQLLPPLAQQQRRQLDPTLLLALLLASERRKGAASFWAPYIAALPEEVPCGWALAPDQLTAALGALGPQAAAWRAPVEAAAASVAQRCEAAAAAYGQELGGLGAEELRWALGQVVSRCFGAGADLALLPWLDLHNHRQHADAPQGCACCRVWLAVWLRSRGRKRRHGPCLLRTGGQAGTAPQVAGRADPPTPTALAPGASRCTQVRHRCRAAVRRHPQPAAGRGMGGGCGRRGLHHLRGRWVPHGGSTAAGAPRPPPCWHTSATSGAASGPRILCLPRPWPRPQARPPRAERCRRF